MAGPAPQSPLWWLNKLYTQLNDRQADMALMDAYYSGRHPLPFLTKSHEEKLRNEFRELLQDSRANFMELVIDAVQERLRVEGFRLSASSDQQTDKASWDIWQANDMDSESPTAFLESLIKGVAYLSVWPNPDDERYPTIAVEDPTQTIVGYMPGSNFRKRAAALKVWNDDWTGLMRANVYLPDGIHKFQAKPDPASNAQTLQSRIIARIVDNQQGPGPRWLPLDDGDDFVPNPLASRGIVPIVPLRNKGRLLVEGVSEITSVYRIQNSINGLLSLLAFAAYFAAHRQRWMVGGKIMQDEKGQDMEPFDVAVDRLWHDENPEVKFGEFGQTDLTGYIKAIEQKVLHIAVITRTPRHYLFQEGQSPSGDAIESAESGLVKKVEQKQEPFGAGLEEAMRIARMYAGEQDAPIDSEIVWGDPQTETIGSLTDGVIKQFAAGLIPWGAALEKLGYTPQQIMRFQAQRMQDRLLGDLFNPPEQQPQEPGQAEPPPVTA